MFKLRLLLVYIGGLGLILGSDSYLYPPYSDPSSYGYFSYSPTLYGAYEPFPYGKVYSNSGSYGGSCADTKTLDVLDHIFCNHGSRKRYSSTIYPTINVVIDQIKYLYDFCFLQAVFDYLDAATETLKTLQDEIFENFGNSSLLEPYFEEIPSGEGKSEGSEGVLSGSGTRTTAIVANRLASVKEKLKTHEKNAKIFKTSRKSAVEEENKQVQQTHHKVEGQNSKSDSNSNYRSERASSLLEQVKTETGQAELARQATLANLKKRMTRVKIEAKTTSRRRTRDTEYSGDYTCSLLPALYCDYDKFDELLYNILERIFSVLEFLDQALFETWFFMEEIACNTDEDRWALQEAAVTYGALQMVFRTMIDVIIQVDRMYKLVELDYGDETSFRAASGGPSTTTYSTYYAQPPPPQPEPVYSPAYPITNKKPIMILSKAPAIDYPFSQYMGQAVVNYPTNTAQIPVMQSQQYRPVRALTPLKVTSTISSHQSPSVLIYG